MDDLWERFAVLEQQLTTVEVTEATAPVVELVDSAVMLMGAVLRYIHDYCTNRED